MTHKNSKPIPEQTNLLNPIMCEYCHKRVATRQRITYLYVCDKCDIDVDKEIENS